MKIGPRATRCQRCACGMLNLRNLPQSVSDANNEESRALYRSLWITPDKSGFEQVRIGGQIVVAENPVFVHVSIRTAESLAIERVRGLARHV